jgi:hypothetical protein
MRLAFLQEKARTSLLTKIGNRHFFEGCGDEMQMEKTKIFKGHTELPVHVPYTVLQLLSKYYKLQKALQ